MKKLCRSSSEQSRQSWNVAILSFKLAGSDSVQIHVMSEEISNPPPNAPVNL